MNAPFSPSASPRGMLDAETMDSNLSGAFSGEAMASGTVSVWQPQPEQQDVPRQSPQPLEYSSQQLDKALDKRLAKVAGNVFQTANELIQATLEVKPMSSALKAQWQALWYKAEESDRSQIALQLYTAAYGLLGTVGQQAILRQIYSSDIGLDMLVRVVSEEPERFLRMLEVHDSKGGCLGQDMWSRCLNKMADELSDSRLQELTGKILSVEGCIRLSGSMRAQILKLVPISWRRRINYFAVTPGCWHNPKRHLPEPETEEWLCKHSATVAIAKPSSLHLFTDYISWLSSTPGVVQGRREDGRFLRCVIPGSIRGALRRFLFEAFHYKKQDLQQASQRLLNREFFEEAITEEAIAFVLMCGVFRDDFYYPSNTTEERQTYLPAVRSMVGAVVSQNPEVVFDLNTMTGLPEIVKDLLEVIALLLYVHPLNHTPDQGDHFEDVYAGDNGSFSRIALSPAVGRERVEKMQGYTVFPLCNEEDLDELKLQGTSDIVVPAQADYGSVVFVCASQMERVVCVPVKKGKGKLLLPRLKKQLELARIHNQEYANVAFIALNHPLADENLPSILSGVAQSIQVSVYYPQRLASKDGERKLVWGSCSLEQYLEVKDSLPQSIDPITCGLRLHGHSNELVLKASVGEGELTGSEFVIPQFFHGSSCLSFCSPVPDCAFFTMVSQCLNLAQVVEASASPALKSRLQDLSELSGIRDVIQEHALNSTHLNLAYSGLQNIRHGLRCPNTGHFPENMVVPALNEQGELCEYQEDGALEPLASGLPCEQLQQSMVRLNTLAPLSHLDYLQRLRANIKIRKRQREESDEPAVKRLRKDAEAGPSEQQIQGATYES